MIRNQLAYNVNIQLRCFAFIAAIALLSSGAHAQRIERLLNTEAHAIYLGIGSNSFDVEWAVDSSGNLTYMHDAQLIAAVASSSVADPGCLQVISATDVLIGGRDVSGVGRLEHWRAVPGASATSLVQISSLTLPGKDLVGVAYSAATGRLYLLDCNTKAIYRSPWSPVTSLATVSISLFAGTADVADLVDSDQRHMALTNDGATPTLSLFNWPFSSNQVAVTVRDLGSSIVLGYYRVGVAPEYDVFVDDTTVSEGATSVKVFAPPGTVVEVIDGDAEITLGAGVADALGECVVSLSMPLILNHRYCAERVGDPLVYDRGAICVRRYGVPEVFADGTAIDQVHYQLGARIGTEFWMEVGMQHPTNPTTDQIYDGIMLFAFRDGGVDPIVPYGGNLLLLAPVYIPATGVVASGNGWGMAFSVLNIPNDPGLVGLVFLTQFAMQDGQEYRLSQIYGSVIEGVGTTAMRSSAAGTEQTRLLRAALHTSAGLLRGQVFDATLRLAQMRSRR